LDTAKGKTSEILETAKEKGSELTKEGPKQIEVTWEAAKEKGNEFKSEAERRGEALHDAASDLVQEKTHHELFEENKGIALDPERPYVERAGAAIAAGLEKVKETWYGEAKEANKDIARGK